MVGALDLLLALLQGSPAHESFAVFLLEPGNLEVLLALLVRPASLPLLPDRVCKVHPARLDPGIPFTVAPARGPGWCSRPWADRKPPSPTLRRDTHLCGGFPSDGNFFPMTTPPPHTHTDPAQTAA